MKMTKNKTLHYKQTAEGKWTVELWLKNVTDAKGRLIKGDLLFKSEPYRRKEQALRGLISSGVLA